MTIIGGGIVTPVMGFVSDAAGKIPTAELVPALCFTVIFILPVSVHKRRQTEHLSE